MTAVIYGIPNCDSVRKARRWLEENDISYRFVDVREDTPTRSRIQSWIDSLGALALVNKRSSTWKQLSDAEREEIAAGDVLDTLQAKPTLIKRPVLEFGNTRAVGFKPDDYARRFGID